MTRSRRDFIKTSASAAAAATLTTGPWIRLSSASPNDTLHVGLIGARSMGYGDLAGHLRQPNVVCAGLCDVDREVLEGRAGDVEEMTGTRPRLFADFRELLAADDLDAVIIGTPDHWHCLQTIHALEAGKDVYVEKPLANSIAECDAMVEAVRRHGRIVQVGQQQRSGQAWQDVVEFVRSGKLGDVRLVKVWGFFDYGKGLPQVPNEPPPPHVDFDMWLGPAPEQPYNPSRFHTHWRHQWDFGGGLLSDWGVHLIDIVLWAMDVRKAPRSVSAVGGIYTYTDRAIETPDTLSVIFDMGDYAISYEHLAGLSKSYYGRGYGIAFIGNNGTLVVNRSGWEVIAEERDDEPAMKPVPFVEGVESNHERHAINFIESVRSRKDPLCTIEVGRDAAEFAHLGNIALRTGSRLIWDADARTFTANDEANDLLTPHYREPWSFPG